MKQKLGYGSIGALLAVIVCLYAFNIKGNQAYNPGIVVSGNTTDASTHTLYTSPALANNGDFYRLTVDIVAYVGTNFYRARKTTLIKKASGSAAIVANTVSDLFTPTSEGSLGGVGCSIGVSGSSAIVEVSGIAATTVNWQANVTIN